MDTELIPPLEFPSKWELHVNGKVVDSWVGDLPYDKLNHVSKRYCVDPSFYKEARVGNGTFAWGCGGKCVLQLIS